MSNNLLDEINEEIKNSLPYSRYIHTIGVAYTAAALAMKYNCNIQSARIAGLLHDYSKKDSSDSYISFCSNNNISINETEYINPGLLHAKISAFYALNRFKIEDTDILSAITYHTTGKPNMTLLEKIIYIADYIEPERNKQPRLDLIRKTAFDDIDNALYMILEDTMKYLKSSGKAIDSQTETTFNYYKGIIL